MGKTNEYRAEYHPKLIPDGMSGCGLPAVRYRIAS
jgi:hypothetical protein